MKLSGFSVLPVLTGVKRPQGEMQPKLQSSVRFQADYEDERPEPSPKKILWQELVRAMRYVGKRHSAFNDPGLKDKMKELTQAIFKMMRGLENYGGSSPPKIPQSIMDILKDLQVRAQTKPATLDAAPVSDAPTPFEKDFTRLMANLTEQDVRFADPAVRAHLREYCLTFRDERMGAEGVFAYLVPTPIYHALVDIINTALKTARPPQSRKLFSKKDYENDHRNLLMNCSSQGLMFLDHQVTDKHINGPLYQALSTNTVFLEGMGVDRLVKQEQAKMLWQGDVSLFESVSPEEALKAAKEAVLQGAIRGAVGNIAHLLHYQMSDDTLRNNSPLILTRQADGRIMGQFEGQNDPPPFDMTVLVKNAIMNIISGPSLSGKAGEIFTETFMTKLMNGEILGTYDLMRNPEKSTADRLVLEQVPHVMGGNDTLYRKLYPASETGA